MNKSHRCLGGTLLIGITLTVNIVAVGCGLTPATVEATDTNTQVSTPIATNSPVPEVVAARSPTPETTNVEGVYYIAADGSDANPGSLAQPWKTISVAVSKLVAGDTLYLRAGTYTQTMSVEVSGTASAPITISAYPNETVILEGQGTTPSSAGSYMIAIKGDWITVKDLEVANSGQGGVYSGGAHVTVQNMRIHHAQGAAITLSGDYDLALNNRAWSDGLENENNKSGVTGGWPAIITCARAPRHCTIRGNTVSDSWGEGISTFEATYTTIEDNVSYNNQQNFYISDTKFTVMRRNLSYCTPGNPIDPYMTQNGILVGDEKGVLIDGVRQPSSDNQIVNNLVMGCDRNLAAGTKVSTNNLYAYNTFVNSGGDTSEKANVLIYASGSCTTCRFTNNLILQEDSIPVALGGGLSTGWTFSNNLWSKAPDSNFNGDGDVIADPLLAKIGSTGPGQLTADYFKITSGSPAVNKAKTISEVAEDVFRKARDFSPDIGAYEYATESSSLAIPTSSSNVVLVGAGDISSCSNDNDEATAKLLDNIPGTVFTTGDNAYPDGSPADFTNCYDPTWGRHQARTKPVLGNHEYHTADATAYFQYFDNIPSYYAYNLGSWRIYALNSQISVASSSAQIAWLQADLAANPSQCVLAYWHTPRWSSSSTHGSNSYMGTLWETLYNAGAEVVINGHAHNYERFSEMDASGSPDSEGLREIVVGTGGGSLYTFGTPLAGSQVRNDSTYGVLKLTLRAGGYNWEFVPVTGSTFTDSGSDACH